MGSNWWERDRTPFPLKARLKDYSGQDFKGVFLTASDGLSHSFFNGSTIADSAFVSIPFDHVELADAFLARDRFWKVDLTASDFVRSRVQGAIFDLCDFSGGDWRNSDFADVMFVNCSFSHTTINLCTFTRCGFVGRSASGLDHQSVNYNTFTECMFESEITDELVISRNFGLPLRAGINKAIRPKTAAATLEQLCLQSGTGATRVIDLIVAIEREIKEPKARLKQSRLEFISKIVSALSAQRKISSSSLIYIEDLLLELAKKAENDVEFLAAMAAIVNLRNALYNAVTRDPFPGLKRINSVCESLSVRFEGNFTAADAEVMASVLSEIIFEEPGGLVVKSVKSGSTLVELIFTATTTITSVIAALNLILSQATIFFKKTNEAICAERALIRTLSSKQITKRRKPTRVAAIVNAEHELPQLKPVRNAIRKTGKTLVKMDEPAHIEIRYQQSAR